MAEKSEKEGRGLKLIIALALLVVLTGYIILNSLPSDQEPETTTTTILTPEVPGVKHGDMIRVDYVGKFENGTVFDTSLESEAKKAGLYNPNRPYEPLVFTVGQGLLIEGFEKGVLGMEVEEKRTLVIPPQEGYASGPFAGKTLVFEVTLKEIVEPVAVNLIVLNDKRCENCDVTGLLEQLRTVFPKLDVKELDYSTAEGKKIYQDSGTEFLPALLFDDSVKEAANYNSVQSFLDLRGEYYSLRIGASFNPAAEICDNNIDDNSNGLVDCEDSECASELICNTEALVECAEPYNLTADTIIFYYSDSCGYCQRMKPIVEKLQEEGYNFYWANVMDAEAGELIETCFREYMSGGGVPQFICVKTGGIQVGAMPEDTLRDFADNCIAT